MDPIDPMENEREKGVILAFPSAALNALQEINLIWIVYVNPAHEN